MKKLIAKHVYDERQFFRDLLESENVVNVDDILNDLNIKDDIYTKEYYKDDNGNMFTRCLYNGQKVSWNDFNNYVKGVFHKFESESKVYFQ